MKTLTCALGAALALALVGAALGQTAAAQPGRLVIAGGALARDTASVHQAFLDHLGPDGRVAIIPAASGEPAQSAAAAAETLALYGVSADRIDVVALAVMDDPETPAVDESTWAGNATNAAEIAKIEGAAAIWMTGGDQARIVRALIAPDGTDTAMLAAMRRRLAAGAVIGGTSAGAAVMSPIMIARGDSLAALTQPLGTVEDSTMDGGDLALSQGLGFFPLGLVDQHFDRKARLGRLTRALAERPQAQRIGFGIDENTALVIDLSTQTATALGRGGVTLLDARGMQSRVRRGRFAAEGVVLSLLNAGDTVDLATLAITPAAAKDRIQAGHEYYTHAPQSGAGLALPNASLEEALGVELVDNREGRRLERVSFDARGVGVRYVFEEDDATWGALGDDEAGIGRYTVSGIRFSIEPVRVTIRSAG